MSDENDLAQRFQAQRPRLHAIVTRLLGSTQDADDALQEAWLRLRGADIAAVRDLDAWLTTVVSRIGLDMLRAPRRQRERPWQVDLWRDEPRAVRADPAEIIADGDRVSVALLVVLEALSPAERIAFVLHDVFGESFDEIAVVLERTPAAARQLASRGRRRVREVPEPVSRMSRRQERTLVDAWLAAVEGGDLDGLLRLLDDGAVLHADYSRSRTQTIIGSDSIAAQAILSRRLAAHSTPVLIDGLPGVAAKLDGRIVSLMKFTSIAGKITQLDVLADPGRLVSIGDGKALPLRDIIL